MHASPATSPATSGGTAGAEDTVVERFRAGSPAWLLTLLYMGAPTVTWLALLGRFVADHDARGIVVFSILCGFTVPLTALFCVWMLRPVVLTSTELLVPRGLRNHRTVSLEDVVAVGLVYARGQQSAGWDPYVWYDGGRSVRLPGLRFLGQSVYRSAAKTAAHPPSPQSLANSRAGRVCQTIRAAALACQPPDGPMASDRAQYRTPTNGDASLALAYWSTDPAVGLTFSPTHR